MALILGSRISLILTSRMSPKLAQKEELGKAVDSFLYVIN